jgi:CMP-N-acetylneuraminic acid synthetase
MIPAYRSKSSREFAEQPLLTWIILAVLECQLFASWKHDFFES